MAQVQLYHECITHGMLKTMMQQTKYWHPSRRSLRAV